LQDRLGTLNDMVVARSIANGSDGPDLTEAALPGRTRASVRKELGAGQGAFARFKATEPFWR
jgi:hypothetical protein